MKSIFRPELLSPVGDMERLDAALNFGADAVYIGGNEYGMRAAAANFGFEQMKKAAAYAIASLVSDSELCETYILPAAFDKRVGPAVAQAVSKAARKRRSA